MPRIKRLYSLSGKATKQILLGVRQYEKKSTMAHDRIRRNFRKYLFPYALLAPALGIIIVVVGYSWALGVKTSFYRWEPFYSLVPEFIGLKNYILLAKDALFLKSLWLTALFTGGTVTIQFVVGFVVALGLNRITGKTQTFFRTAVLLPYMITPAVVGLIWKFFMDKDFGFINSVLVLLRLSPLSWIASPETVLPSIIVVSVWLNVPFVAIIILAGLQALPQEVFEAGEIDGATALQKLYHLTLPLLKPAIALVLLFQLMYAIRAFDYIFVLARGGGPGKNAMLLSIYLYERTFFPFMLGRAAAVSVVILVITCVIGVGLVISMYRETKF